MHRNEDITVQDSYGWTGLHLAVWTMRVDVVKFLLGVVSKSSWVSVQNKGVSILHLVTCNNDIEVLKLLLNARANITLQSKGGRTSSSSKLVSLIYRTKI